MNTGIKTMQVCHAATEENAATDYFMSGEDAESLAGLTALPHDFRVKMLRIIYSDKGEDKILELFSNFIGLANSVASNCREMAELTLITEYDVHPRTAEKINFPTVFGALIGVKISEKIEQSNVCGGCAFRMGSIANQCPSTVCDADWCSNPDEMDFMCHESLDGHGDPYLKCKGFAQLRKIRKMETKEKEDV